MLLSTTGVLAAQTVSFTEYLLQAGSGPNIITAGPDGAQWFTEFNGNRIGRITTAGVTAEYSLPISGSGPQGITAGPDGALWFTESTSKIGRITTSGAITEYAGVSGNADPEGIAAGPDGALWFTEWLGNRIGRITTTGNVTEYLLPTPNSMPKAITAGPDGALWFTEWTGNKIGRITTAGVITEYVVPTAGCNPAVITAGPDGALWFTEWLGSKIGRIDTSGRITEYSLPNGARFSGITAGPDGAVWFTEWLANRIGRITTSGVISDYVVPTTTNPLQIAAGADGALWFMGSTDKIGRAALPSCNYDLFSPVAWFGTAAFGNRIGVIATGSTCSWTASSPADWVIITSGSGTGNGSVNYDVLANTASAPRSATLTVAGLPFTVNQAGQGCLFGLSPSNALVVSTGGSLSATVGLSGSDCAWTASSNASWITITTSSGLAGESLRYSVASNASSGVSRTGTITLSTSISQITYMVTQSGSACSYSLSQASQAFSATGGLGSTTVSAPAGCTWTADASAASFVTIVGIFGALGASGTGTVSFSVAANSGPARTGRLTVAGQTYVIEQAGTGDTAGCTASAGPIPAVALEGRTEVLSDLVLSCSGFIGAVTADVTLVLNTNVTNSLTAGITDAILTVNTGVPQNGQLLGNNSIQWRGVVLGPGATFIRIRDVRADASLLAAGKNLLGVPIAGTIHVGATQPVPVANAQLTMATASPALLFQKAADRVSLTFQETAPGAFRSTGTPTRLRAVLTNIPGGTLLDVPLYPSEGANKAQLYSADSTGAGGSPVTLTQFEFTPYHQVRTGEVPTVLTWVVLATDPSQIETWTFPIDLGSGTADDVKKAQATGSLAPVSDVGVASSIAPVPRYRDFSVPPVLTNLRWSTALQPPAGAGYLAGSNVTLIYTLLNDTSDPSQRATDVTVRNTLPGGLSLVSCTATGGVSCGGSGNLVQVSYGQIAAGQSQTVTVVARIDPTLANGTVLTSIVGATSDQITADPTTATAEVSLVVLNGTPVPANGTPNSGSGPGATFTYTFTHPYGYQNLNVLNVLINNGLDAHKACYLAYVVPIATLVLVDDTGNAGGPFAGAVVLGDQSIIRNSQCAVGLVSAQGNGNTFTLKLNITFTSSFGGNRIVYTAARDQASNNSDWQTLGVWQAPWTPSGTIQASGMTPARSDMPAGTTQLYTFSFTDIKGAADLGILDVLVNTGLDARKACYLAYVAATNTVLLVNDNGDAGASFAGSIVPGQPQTAQNSQCVVTGTGGGVVASGSTLSLTLGIAFKPSFVGNRVFYLAARDANNQNNTDWQAMGSSGIQ